jgi:hypothetical protein
LGWKITAEEKATEIIYENTIKTKNRQAWK